MTHWVHARRRHAHAHICRLVITLFRLPSFHDGALLESVIYDYRSFMPRATLLMLWAYYYAILCYERDERFYITMQIIYACAYRAQHRVLLMKTLSYHELCHHFTPFTQHCYWSVDLLYWCGRKRWYCRHYETCYALKRSALYRAMFCYERDYALLCRRLLMRVDTPVSSHHHTLSRAASCQRATPTPRSFPTRRTRTQPVTVTRFHATLVTPTPPHASIHAGCHC
jgi:hypothetical protein